MNPIDLDFDVDWSTATIDKAICKGCGKTIEVNFPAVQITLSLWVNGYFCSTEHSYFFCINCSKSGFSLIRRDEIDEEKISGK